MKIALLKRSRRRLRIIARKHDTELQVRDNERWEYLYNGPVSESLRVMHNHMKVYLKPFYDAKNAPKIII